MPPSLRTARSTRNARGFPPSTSRSLVPLTNPARPVNYHPFEMNNPDASLTTEELAWLRSEWARFKVRPFAKNAGAIGESFYSVPYNSEKNKPTLEEVTGKRRFDFFAYSFTMPDGRGDDPTSWDIMWDHETGMVRTMSIFRSLGYEKSAPAGTFKSTPTLPHLAVNITGGKIGIQGFWLPFPAALELCTRFAHPIRAVLYPMFGPAIIRRAVPEGHELWKVWKMERRVVEECWAELARVRNGESSAAVGERERIDTPMETPSSTRLTSIGAPRAQSWPSASAAAMTDSSTPTPSTVSSATVIGGRYHPPATGIGRSPSAPPSFSPATIIQPREPAPIIQPREPASILQTESTTPKGDVQRPLPEEERRKRSAMHMDICLERERDAAMAMMLMGQKEALGSRVEGGSSGSGSSLGPFRAW